jgi:dTDP-4-amino-4,6-dideoxygalactose transaminase
MLNRLDEFTNARTTNAARLLEGLSGIPGIRTITPLHGATPVYSRLPVLIPDSNVRSRALETLRGIGIGATGSYPTSLADVSELRAYTRVTPNAAGGRYVSEHIVTLPTHTFVTAADVNRTIAAIADETVDVTLDAIISST